MQELFFYGFVLGDGDSAFGFGLFFPFLLVGDDGVFRRSGQRHFDELLCATEGFEGVETEQT
jgi:hypothetical protein